MASTRIGNWVVLNLTRSTSVQPLTRGEERFGAPVRSHSRARLHSDTTLRDTYDVPIYIFVIFYVTLHCLDNRHLFDYWLKVYLPLYLFKKVTILVLLLAFSREFSELISQVPVSQSLDLFNKNFGSGLLISLTDVIVVFLCCCCSSVAKIFD